MTNWKNITPNDLKSLPITYQHEIPESYLDEMGHMNVMWYTHLFSWGMDGIFQRVGLTAEYFASGDVGTFALEDHVRYIAEVRVGQHVTIRTRLVGRSGKRFHFMHFMTNDDTGALAATSEIIGTHVDLRIRRSSPFPDEIVVAFDRLLAEHAALPWPAPLSGVMRV